MVRTYKNIFRTYEHKNSYVQNKILYWRNLISSLWMKKRQCRVKIPASDREKFRKSAKMSTAGSKKNRLKGFPKQFF